jgi:hypothetical protein
VNETALLFTSARNGAMPIVAQYGEWASNLNISASLKSTNLKYLRVDQSPSWVPLIQLGLKQSLAVVPVRRKSV